MSLNGVQESPVFIEERCRKSFVDMVFTKISGDAYTHAIYARHSGAIITIDKTMFCDIHLSESLSTIFIDDTKYIALLRSCFYRISALNYASFSISHYDDNNNQDAHINQTTEANTGEGTTEAAHISRCRNLFFYCMNNISHANTLIYHSGIAIGPITEKKYRVTMNQVVECKKGNFFHTYYKNEQVHVSNINFINNKPVSPAACFGNDMANGCVFEKCNFALLKGSNWIDTQFESPCTYRFDNCLLTGYLPPQHSYVDTNSLATTNRLSTFRIKKIGEGACRGESNDFSVRILLSMKYAANALFLALN